MLSEDRGEVPDSTDRSRKGQKKKKEKSCLETEIWARQGGGYFYSTTRVM